MRKRIENSFFQAVGVLLFVAAAFILLATTSPAQVWERPDPLLGVASQSVFYFFGAANLALSAFLLGGRNAALKLALVTWNALNFSVYYVGLKYSGGANLFRCLGNVSDLAPLSPRMLNGCLLGLLAFQLAGVCLLFCWRRPGSAAPCVPPGGLRAKPQPALDPSPAAPSGALRRLLLGWGSAAALTLTLLAAAPIHLRLVMPRNLDASLEAAFGEEAVQETVDLPGLPKPSSPAKATKPARILKIWCAPVDDHTGRLLLSAFDTQGRPGFWLLDLDTLQRRPIALKDSDGNIEGNLLRLFGWSPDDRLLAFSYATTRTNGQKIVKHQRVAVCDGSSGAVKQTFEVDPAARLERGVWLSTNTLVLQNSSEKFSFINFQPVPAFGRFGPRGLVEGPRSHGSRARFWADSAQSLTYFDNGNLCSFDLCQGRPRQLTRFSDAKLEWLDYDAERRQYLMALTHASQPNIQLIYRFAPASGREPEPLPGAELPSVYGQWLLGGAAILRVESLGKTNRLALQRGDQLWRPEFIPDGSLQRWGASTVREKVYAVAYDQRKEIKLWECDPQDKSFRDLLSSELRPAQPSLAKAAPPQAASPKGEKPAVPPALSPVALSTTNSGGETVPYFVVAPPALDSHRKYPVFLALWANVSYHRMAGPLAQAGIFYVATSPFDVNDWRIVAQPDHVAAIRKALLSNPNVDPQAIYLAGTSSTSWAVANAVQSYPELWHGAFVISPVSFPKLPASAGPFPSFVLFEGEEDQLVWQERAEQFRLEACRLGLPVRLRYNNIGHTFQTREVALTCGHIIQCILSER